MLHTTYIRAAFQVQQIVLCALAVEWLEKGLKTGKHVADTDENIV